MQRGQLSQEMLQRVLWLRERLLCWFEQHRRSFPWREPVRSSYELVVAEILLQRTTAAKVAHAFPSFVDRYPTWEAVASTPLEELQISIRPLGLWRQKAQVFLDLANEVEKNRGVLPCSRRDLEASAGRRSLHCECGHGGGLRASRTIHRREHGSCPEPLFRHPGLRFEHS